MSETRDTAPESIRRLETDEAGRLARLVAAYDDLQTVLRCCERLVSLVGDGTRDSDDVAVEALWTLALLSYARAFASAETGSALTEDDLIEPTPAPGSAAAGEGEVIRWHRMLMHLRDFHADPAINPRESYTVGVAQDDEGTVNAVAVSGIRLPPVDTAAVRQAGALAFPLCGVLDSRIEELHKSILSGAREMSRDQLDQLERVEIASA